MAIGIAWGEIWNEAIWGNVWAQTRVEAEEGLPGGGGKRRKRRRDFQAFAYYKFRERYLKALEDEEAPELPEPVKAQVIELNEPVIKPATNTESVRVEAQKTINELDSLMAKVRADLVSTEAEIVKIQSLKRKGPSRLKRLDEHKEKSVKLTEKSEVLQEAKAYTEEIIEDSGIELEPETISYDDEELILFVTKVLLQ